MIFFPSNSDNLKHGDLYEAIRVTDIANYQLVEELSHCHVACKQVSEHLCKIL